MDSTIQSYYEKNNLPSAVKLTQIMKKDGVQVTQKQVQDYLNRQTEYQQTKPKLRRKAKEGHHIAFGPGQTYQMDIYDMQSMRAQNKNKGYIFALIDVFTRRAYAEPMTNKSIDDVLTAFKTIIGKIGPPKVLTSDSDATFTSDQFQKLLRERDIVSDMVVASNDHPALALIDRFALTLKTIFTKTFLRNKSTNWVDHLADIIRVYNNTQHTALDGLTPNEANEEANHHAVVVINKAKMMNQKINRVEKPEFAVGDYCRVSLAATFRKGTKPKYSDSVYQVKSVAGQRITLDDDKVYLASKLMKVVDGVAEKAKGTAENVIDKVAKEHKIEQALKKEDIKSTNVVRTKRVSKPKKVIDV